MPPKKEQKTKAQKLQAALAGSKKSKKKKWAKGRVREKKDNAAIFTQRSYDSAMKDIPKQKMITIASVSEKFKITGSLASRLIRKLAKEGQIRKIYHQSGFMLYARSLEAQRAAEKAAIIAAERSRKKKAKKKK